jgi:hypothetical protein
MLKKVILFVFLLFILQFSTVKPSYTAGLSTSFGKILIENLQIGETYNTKDLINLPLKIKNTSNITLTLKVEPAYPGKNQLEMDFEAIPDLSWIKIEKEILTIPAKETRETNLFLSIPKNKKYLGKKFIVYFWSHSIAGTGSIAIGLKSKLLFTIASKHSPLPKGGAFQDETGKIKGNYQFSVLPYDIVVKNIKMGKVYNLKQTLKIINPNKKYGFTYEIKSLCVEDVGGKPKEGYEDTPNPGFLTFNKTKIFVPAKEEREVKMYLSFPKEKEYKGKKYVFIIQVKILGEKVHLKVLSRLYVTVNK